MLTLFEVGAGEHQLRIEPQNSSPADGDYVFCLGSDLVLPPVEDFEIGDSVQVSGTYTLSGEDFIKLQGRFRQPAGVPQKESLPGTPTVTRTTRGAKPDITRLNVATNFFDSSHNERDLDLQGTGIVDGTYKIAYVENPQQVVLKTSPLAAPGGPISVDTLAELVGAYWQLDIYRDTTPIYTASFGEDGIRQRDIDLPDITFQVSRLAGSITVKAILQLVKVT